MLFFLYMLYVDTENPKIIIISLFILIFVEDKFNVQICFLKKKNIDCKYYRKAKISFSNTLTSFNEIIKITGNVIILLHILVYY